MATRRRLDAELVRRGMARSRGHAAELITAGRVKVKGLRADKAATNVDPADPVLVVGEADDYVSRGAHKLIGALREFAEWDVNPQGRRCLDAGASTGGFTQVLLRQGARQVVAVDVGYGQLAWALRNDPRVEVHERTNIRHLDAASIDGLVDLTVADLSFISLRTVLPALIACTNDNGTIVPMVKPQFEAGKDKVGARGVVRDAHTRAEAVLSVIETATQHGWTTVAVTPSPMPGPNGNMEFFCAMRKTGQPLPSATVHRVVAEASRQQAGESS